MKSKIPLLLALALPTAFIFSQKAVPDGAYSILSGQYGTDPATTVADSDKRIFKIFKDGYWIAPWSMKKDSSFYGAGGGTYTCMDGKYTETLSFYSWDSTAVGKTYSFDYSAEGKFYHQWGNINSDKYPDFWIDEMMKREDGAEPLKNNGLEGVWSLENAQWANDKFDSKANPNDVGMKIYAYPMAAYVYWNKKTGKLINAGAGTYQFDGKVLIEKTLTSNWDTPGKVRTIDVTANQKQYSQSLTDAKGIYKETWLRAPEATTAFASNSDQEKDKAAIQQVITKETEYWLDLNYNAWANSFIHQPSLVWTVTNGGDPGDGLTMRGWDAMNGYIVKNWFENDAAAAMTKEMKKGKMTRDHWEIQLRGDVAWASYDQHNVTDQQTMSSTEVRVMERVNGVWKIATQATVGDFKDAVPQIRSRY